MVAVGEMMGYVDLRKKDKSLQSLLVPPNPGSMVYLPYLEFLEDLFMRALNGNPFEQALHLGSLEYLASNKMGEVKQLGFYLDASDLMKHHLLITGISGSGKTHTANVIIEELVNKTYHPVVVLDPHGENVTVGLAGRRLNKLVEEGRVSRKEYAFDFSVLIYTCNMERVNANLQSHDLTLGKDRFHIKPVFNHWTEIHNEKVEHEIKHELKDMIGSFKVTILDSMGLSAEERQRLFVNFVEALWSSRVDGDAEQLMLVIEEAEALEAGTIGRIASEGNKLGISLCLLSQHPTGIDDRILSQMGIQMIGRTTDAMTWSTSGT